MNANVLGVTLTKTHEGVNFAVDQFATARDAAREILLNESDLKAKDVQVRGLAQTGESINPASVTLMQSQLKRQELGRRGHREKD